MILFTPSCTDSISISVHAVSANAATERIFTVIAHVIWKNLLEDMLPTSSGGSAVVLAIELAFAWLRGLCFYLLGPRIPERNYTTRVDASALFLELLVQLRLMMLLLTASCKLFDVVSNELVGRR